eukprot:CAMPEP_0118642698 /NCGR_PEP_ID=MMETSP0785-20121206/5972_1 /TAXON_ID=91992 /ORGANISM="Bolidomonas pacifica, Strain CCMP 1866" /LENGTH=127 /DNA_ID=CAMNT_0006534263 /DNA_START=553 /DNA_END=936 /DNA_ORIENTATION=-
MTVEPDDVDLPSLLPEACGCGVIDIPPVRHCVEEIHVLVPGDEERRRRAAGSAPSIPPPDHPLEHLVDEPSMGIVVFGEKVPLSSDSKLPNPYLAYSTSSICPITLSNGSPPYATSIFDGCTFSPLT